MPASHFERMLWNFIKNYFLAGFILFLTPDLLPLTLVTTASIILVYLGYVQLSIVLSIGLALIFLGLLFRNKILGIKVSILIALILIGVMSLDYLNVIPLEINKIMTLETTYSYYLVAGLIIGWLIFNSSYMIIETAEFFSSTTGLLILLGSDEKHVFLSPLPQLLMIIATGIAIYYYLTYRITIMLFSLIVMVIFTLIAIIYMFFKGKGRIVRSAYAIFSMFTSYLIIATLFNQNYQQATIVNIVITMVTILFMMQSRMRSITVIDTTEKIKPPVAVLIVYGTIMALFPIIKDVNMGNQSILPLIWQLNILASLFAAIIIAIYLKTSGKLAWYQKRDKISTRDLLIETTLVLGSKFLEELVKVAKMEIEQTIKKASEKASDIAKKINDTIEKIKKGFSKFFGD